MPIQKTAFGRRSFLKSAALTGGGLVLGFNWLTSCTDKTEAEILAMPDQWFEINAYLKIGDNGVVTIYTPNPEFGQNIKTSMPMIVAEELDADWTKVISEVAPYNSEIYGFQFTGGSRGIASRWDGLRMAGATARHMLRDAAAQAWQVPVAEVSTAAGLLNHTASGRSASYGEMAAAASALPIPEEVELKEIKDFRIIGHDQKNLDGKKIVSGQPLFGHDHREKGQLTAMVVQPPAFGMRFQAIQNLADVKAMPGIRDVFTIQTYKDGFEKGGFDTNAFPELVAIVGESTWQVMKAKKAIQVEWQTFEAFEESVNGFGGKSIRKVPAGLENSTDHLARMEEMAARPGRQVRKDGNPEAAFQRADRVIERSYSAPFLAHNCMEPINCFAQVEEDRVRIVGPTQAPGMIEPTIAARMGLPVENIEIAMSRMGGGFGRRAYSHYMLEAALIAQQAKAPIHLIYTREDDMANGIYRPAYHATYRAALDATGTLTALHVKAGGIPESPLFANRFPAGAVDNYLAEDWTIDSNITIGAFRAPRSNFMAGAEQAFLDEVAEAAGKDPIQFRLNLLARAQQDPVGENNDYDPARYAGVLELVREMSNWDETPEGVHRGVSAYFCHNSYAAHVLDLTIEKGKPIVEKVCCAIDCGIVVNPDAARNMAEGAIVDGVGNALFGELTFAAGVPEKQNFDAYRMIRMSETPKKIEVHFVQNDIKPTGMGEPPFPPVFGAVANAIYKATGERRYRQPFLGDERLLG
ncbi:molybdopterin-dependent oxidoreductase [Neolewinella lacunae]|uniref:Xanthine dehydrogenase family protein molybdopterin-binding subunit n=1 Tax=Neolewinella lacunae TaxID=1517758 RepID=A0A923PGL7_9BACT|nr:molybdopterin cofactor-binding domain-containing protein [Neolewinella lacunae]MBC6993743.1 xanthine dehydrogenase family protein molybdopterin-binding subunit [Neolewinella lacunae]MDN3635256.1 molybdopterin-dependent oxidoreductase [Neolewinella lacunae]